MASISPTTFGVTGTGFTPNGTVSINVIGSSGTSSVYSFNTTADSNGNINASVSSSFLSNIGSILSIGSSTKLYVYAIDESTDTQSNTVAFTLTNNSSSIPSFMSYPVGMNFSAGTNSPATSTSPYVTIGYTYVENFSGSTLPNVLIYASINSDMSNAVQIGGVTIDQVYWNGGGASGGQAATLTGSLAVDLYTVEPNFTTMPEIIYVVAVDTVYNKRSTVNQVFTY